MLLSALDPALLVYKYEDWQAGMWHCLERCSALTLHRRVVRKYGQEIAMSCEFAAMILQSFPWHANFRGISELRDLRQFMLQELQKAFYVDVPAAEETSLEPQGVICRCVEDPEVLDTWKELLCGCVSGAVLEQFDPQVATWETDSLQKHSEITLLIPNPENEASAQVHHLPLVWNEDSWAARLATQEWWPDLQRCVELHFGTNLGMRTCPGVREKPIPFECTEGFWKSVRHFCQGEDLRGRLIEALAKRVYGIFDASLGDEPLGAIRRFRVTDYWRVHYREEQDRLVLEAFGPHSVGGIG